MPEKPPVPRLLKKVQMQGGAHHCGMRFAECGMGGPVFREWRERANAPPAAAGAAEGDVGPFAAAG